MKFNIITIFPKIFDSYFNESILARAQKEKLIEIKIHNLRDYTTDKHQTVDDTPYGGGAGMVLKIEPIFNAVSRILSNTNIADVKNVNGNSSQFTVDSSQKKNAEDNSQMQDIKNRKGDEKNRIILFSAKGKKYTQADAQRLKKYENLILICGRYEGVDERVAEHIIDEEFSIGEYVLTGGEIPAMIVVDSVSRLLPGVLGNQESLSEESFSISLQSTVNSSQTGEVENSSQSTFHSSQTKKEIENSDLGLSVNSSQTKNSKNSSQSTVHSSQTEKEDVSDLEFRTSNFAKEYPHYTKPEEFNGWKVPAVLLSGNHKEIEKWKKQNSS